MKYPRKAPIAGVNGTVALLVAVWLIMLVPRGDLRASVYQAPDMSLQLWQAGSDPTALPELASQTSVFSGTLLPRLSGSGYGGATVNFGNWIPVPGASRNTGDMAIASTPDASVSGGVGYTDSVTADLAVTANAAGVIGAGSPSGTTPAVDAALAPTAPDTTPPTLVSGVIVSVNSTSQVSIAWNASTDPGGVVYRIFRDGMLVTRAVTTATSYTDSGLTPGTQYCYTIVAYDAAWNDTSPSAPACATTQSNPVSPVAATEFYGPFASWANAKVNSGAVGNGVADDTSALQAALTQVATGGFGASSPASTLYLPKGTYRVTQTLTLLNREQVNIVGDPGTRIVWDGPAGGTLFHLDGCDTSYFARLIFDGAGKAGIVFDHTKVSGSFFDADNVFEDVSFVNGGKGLRGGGAGQGFASIMFRRCTFANCTVDGVTVENWNALDGYLVDCLVSNCHVGLHVYQGSLHPYRSLFVGNGTDIRIDQGFPFLSIVSNQSFNAGQFLYSPSIGQNGGALLLKGNLVVDSAANRPAIEMGTLGPIMLLDNTFANAGTTNQVRLFNGLSPDVLAVGNQCTSANLIGIEYNAAATPPRVNLVDNNTGVARGSLNLTRLSLPPAATNLNRHTVEVSANANDREVQSAINAVASWAGQNPVIHVPLGLHTFTQTIVVPGGLDVTLVGDGWHDQLTWGSSTGRGPMFRFQAPAKAGLQQLAVTEYAKGDAVLYVEGANAVGSRVLLQDCSIDQGVSQNLWLDDCPNLTVEMDGDGHGNTMSGGTSGVSIEQTGRGKFRLFCADSGSNWRTYKSENGGELYVETSWYEDHAADINYASFAGGGTVTFLSGKMASGGGGNNRNGNSFSVANWNGQLLFGLMGAVTDTVNLSGTGNGSVWLNSSSGLALPNWYANNAAGLTFAATQDWNYQGGSNRLGDTGGASAAFTRQMLTKARQEFMLGPTINDTPPTATDVRLIRFYAQQALRDIAIYSGIAP